MKKRTLLLLTLASLLLFSCGEDPDFVDVTTKIIAPTVSPDVAASESDEAAEAVIPTDDTELATEESETEAVNIESDTTGLDDTASSAGEIIWLDKDITVSYVDGKIKVNLRIGNEVLYYDDVIINRYYDSLFATSEEKPVFIKEEENGKYTLSVYKYGRMQSGITCDEFITVGKFIIINNGLYDYNLNCLYNFYDQYSGGIDIAEFYEEENSSNITVSGLSRSGKPVTYRFYTSLPSGELSEDAKLIAELDYSDTTTALYRDKDSIYYSDSESGLNLALPFSSDSVLHSSLYPRKAIFVREQDGDIFGSAFEYCYISSPGLGRAPALFMAVDFSPEVTSFGDSELINLGGTYHVIKDGVYDRNLDYEFGYEIIGDFIYAYDGPIDYAGMVYNSRYEPIYDRYLRYFTRLDDGRYIAITSDDKSLAVIFDKDGNPVYESDDKVLLVGNGFMLMRDSDGVVRLYSPDRELLCEFPEWSEEFYFHYMLSGAKTVDGVMGYYFITENPDDNKAYEDGAEYGSYGNRIWEFYYIPSTGEHGILDNGYSVFAYAKPVLYLYPTEETEVSVTFAHPERLTTVYPAYNAGWQVKAKPDGTLTDEGGREYYALYWEEESGTPYYDFPDGFSVAGKDSAEFLEEKLDELGFTHKEANEFIIYWLPILERSKYNLIRFELTEEREASNALEILPKPDSLLRMAMHIKPMNEHVNIAPQTLPTFERHGFSAVEWGGCIH